MAGIGFGYLASFAFTRWLSAALFGITPHDPATVGLISIVLLIIAELATVIPAYRAASIDPIHKLRTQ